MYHLYMSMNTNLEIERKFLINSSLYPWQGPQYYIVQGYATDDTNCLVRFRYQECLQGQTAPQAFVTIKKFQSAGCNQEYETALDASWALNVINSVCLWTLSKTRRHWLAPDGKTWHIDTFHDQNQGLVLAELELSNLDEVFYRPSDLGPEVTGDRRYSNIQLAKNPWSTWQS